MKNMFNNLIVILFICVFMYGVYWVFKTVSYEIFYEDMVIETINQELEKLKLLKD